MNTRRMEEFNTLNSDALAIIEGGTIKEFFYAIGGGAVSGAGLGAAICSPTGIGAAPCALVGSFYGIAIGGLGYALDQIK